MFTLTINEAGNENFITEEFNTLEQAEKAYDEAVVKYRDEQAKWPNHIQVLNFISIDGLVDGSFEYDIHYFDGSRIAC